MFRSKVTVDLPSVEQKRSMGPIEWVRSLFGAQIDLGTGKEELTMTAWSTLEGLYRSLQRAGVRDAISFLVDRKAIYVDSSEIDDDLSLVWKSAREKRVLDKPFKEMHLVLAHREGGLHLIFDIKVKSEVLLGDPELVIDVSGRPEALRIRPGESAEQFTARVRSWADEPAERERLRLMMQARLERLSEMLIVDLPGAVIDVQAAYVELIKPDARRISALGKLDFGDEAAEPGYHTVPTKRQPGAYGMDPYRHYYHDPYWDLATYMMIGSMFSHSHAWHSPHVVVVNTQGQVLHTGENIPSASDAGWNESAVSVGEEGLQIDPEVEAEAENMGESEVEPGEAGEASESDGGWGEGESSDSSDSGDGGSSDSSCSSGDGGSCGSSCGGGCGGD